MNSDRVATLRIVVKVSLPSVLIAIGFVWFIYLPNQRIIASRRSDLATVNASVVTSPEASFESKRKLSELQKELKSLSNELEIANKEIESVGHRKSKLKETFVSAKSPASAVASTLDLLRRHHLMCIDSRLVPKDTIVPSRTNVDSTKPTMNAASHGDDSNRSRYRIHFRGRFQDVRIALVAIHDELQSVVPISIEMEEPDPMDDNRDWVLVILV